MILRLKSESGTLECEFTEMEKPNMFNFKVYDDFRNYELQFESSFQPITLSEEAREYLMAIYTSSFGFEAALLPDELSGKETECFEVKFIKKVWNSISMKDDSIYELHLKSVSENVAGDGMKKQSITPQSEILKSLEGVRVDKLENVFTPQPTDDELWGELLYSVKHSNLDELKSKFKITRR